MRRLTATIVTCLYVLLASSSAGAAPPPGNSIGDGAKTPPRLPDEMPDLSDGPRDPVFLRGDVNRDGEVGVDDMVLVILHWGVCDHRPCRGDTNDDFVVDVQDLVIVLTAWNASG